MIKEKVEKFNQMEADKHVLEQELKRIKSFLSRKEDNRDTARATRGGKIRVKFAGTACYLPVGVFNAELKKREKEIEKEIKDIVLQMNEL